MAWYQRWPSEDEVARHQRLVIIILVDRDLDGEIGIAVAVDIALDEPVGTGLKGAKLAGDIAERGAADEGEGGVAVGRVAVGVDGREGDPVVPPELEDMVLAPGGRFRAAPVALDVPPVVSASRRLGAEPADQYIGTFVAAQQVVAGIADEEIVLLAAGDPVVAGSAMDDEAPVMLLDSVEGQGLVPFERRGGHEK